MNKSVKLTPAKLSRHLSFYQKMINNLYNYPIISLFDRYKLNSLFYSTVKVLK